MSPCLRICVKELMTYLQKYDTIFLEDEIMRGGVLCLKKLDLKRNGSTCPLL
jgi:hypothetical protein